jgi:hypothetical protein
MRESNTQVETGARQGLCVEGQALLRDRFDHASGITTLQAVEPLLDCAGAAAILGGLHPKTVERWAREGRTPAYHYFVAPRD